MTLRSLLLAASAGTVLIAAPALADGFDPLLPRLEAALPNAPERLRTLPADPKDLEFSGEYARRSFAVHLTDAEAASARELRIKVGDRAVSVLPETAGLYAFVNGRAVGALAGPDLVGSSDVRLTLPPALVVPGFNEVRIEARQEHRVDCSVESGYELWTRLDPTGTGIVHGEPQGALRGTEGLTDLLQGNGSPGTLRLVLPGKIDDRMVGSVIRVAESLALAGRAWRPSVSVVAGPQPGAGTNVRFLPAGDAATLETTAGASELLAGVWSIPRANEPGLRDLALVGGSGAAFDRMAETLAGADGRKASGTREGLAVLAASYGVPIVEEEAMPLSRFGISSIDFGGRRLVEEIRVSLPADFFASGYSAVRLSMSGRYASGLTPDSVVRIRVNDAVAGAIPLSAAGGTWDGHVVQLPLAMFHAGANTIQFEAVVKTVGDLACDPTAGGSGASRISINPTTSLTFPKLARVGNMPEIGSTLLSGYPYTARRTPVPFWIADHDPQMIGVAATVASQLAVAQGRPVAVAVNLRAPIGTDESGFVFAPVNTLPEWLYVPLRDDPAFAADRASGQIPRGDALSPADAGASGPTVVGLTLGSEEPAADDDGIDNPLSFVTEQLIKLRTGELSEKSGDLLAALGRTIRNVSQGIIPREILLPGPSDLVVFQTADLPTGISVGDAIFRAGSVPNAWTVFTADTVPALATGVARVADGQRWNQLSGRLTVVRDGSAQIDALPADHQVMTATRPFSVPNARLALAGWFSRNTPFFAELMLVMCVVVGLLAHVYSRWAGVRS